MRMAGIGRAEADHAGQRQQIGYIRRLRRFFLRYGPHEYMGAFAHNPQRQRFIKAEDCLLINFGVKSLERRRFIQSHDGA